MLMIASSFSKRRIDLLSFDKAHLQAGPQGNFNGGAGNFVVAHGEQLTGNIHGEVHSVPHSPCFREIPPVRASPQAGATPMQPKNGCRVARVVDWIQPALLRHGRAQHVRVVGGTESAKYGCESPHT